jgi:DNA-binding PadR family transcriptional regulator
MSRKPSEDLQLLDQQVMLAVARLHPDAYGVSIQEEIKKAGRAVSFGAIYAALDRLELKGFVQSRQGEPTPERGGRRKLYFVATTRGRLALEGSLAIMDALRNGVRAESEPSRPSSFRASNPTP